MSAEVNIKAHGSPPRAWGRRFLRRQLRFRTRFTPTCVGTAGRSGDVVRPQRFTPTCVGTAVDVTDRGGHATVHPHVRGDGVAGSGDALLGTGSPPRAWGRLDDAWRATLDERFTPTCVGTASGSSIFVSIPSVHPHVRGDGFRVIEPRTSVDGSPPRAWGRLTDQRVDGQAGRFTPTCVGTACVCRR